MLFGRRSYFDAEDKPCLGKIKDSMVCRYCYIRFDCAKVSNGINLGRIAKILAERGITDGRR